MVHLREEKECSSDIIVQKDKNVNIYVDKLPKLLYSGADSISVFSVECENSTRYTSIHEALEATDKVCILDLRNNGLTKIPEDVFDFGDMRTLYLSNNELTHFSPEIGKLKNLEILDISNNDLTSLSGEIGALKNLKELSLSGNRLTSLPSQIGELENLSVLNIDNNAITEFPESIANLKKLTVLNARGNGKISADFVGYLPASVTGFYVDEIDIEPPPALCLEKRQSFRRIECLMSYFNEITKRVNASYAIQVSEELMESEAIDDCHLIAHEIGHATLQKHEFDIARAFSSCSLGCIEGCYHGVVEEYVGSGDKDVEALVSQMVSACEEITDNSLLRRQCIHGAGHGLLASGVMSDKEAVATCSLFQSRDINTCLGGLFMENMSPYLVLNEEHLKETLPAICEEFVASDELGKFASMCLEAVGEGLMFYTGYDLEKSKVMCNELDVADHIEPCHKGARLQTSVTK